MSLALSPVMEFKDVTLDRIPLRAVRRLSSYLMANARYSEFMDNQRDQLEVVYPSWHHQLVASLPDGFRHRFLTYLWELEDEPLGRQTTHTVTCSASAMFPDADILPPGLSKVARFPVIEPDRSYLELVA